MGLPGMLMFRARRACSFESSPGRQHGCGAELSVSSMVSALGLAVSRSSRAHHIQNWAQALDAERFRSACSRNSGTFR